MSVDVTQLQPGATVATPPPAVPDLAGWVATQAQQAIAKTVEDGVAQITAQATAGAAQDAKDLATTLHDQSISAIKEVAASVAPTVAGAVTSAIPQIKAEVLASVGAIADNVQHDKITQRWVTLSGIQILGQITFLFLLFYFLGSPEAKGIVGWAAGSGLATALLGWAATGFKLPNKPAA